MAPKIYGFAGNPRTASCRIAAEYEGLALENVEVDVANKSKEFTDKFPTGLMPALDDDGFKVCETVAVAYYIATRNNKANLFGKTDEEKTQVLQWAMWANTNLLGALAGWFRPIVVGPFNKKASDDSKAQASKLFAILDQYLADKTWLVGQRITYADILMGAVIQRGCDHVIDAAYLNQYPNVARFYNTILRQPEALKIYGKEPSPIAKPKEYVPETKKKADKPAAAPAAAAPKKEKKPAAAADDDDEPAAPAEPKAKHPCEALGKASMVLDEWKRQYSNLDTPVALKWFWENYKPEEYSLWKATYKYPEELSKQVFMNSNLITGFHTRLEGSRKYLFGSACVYGENGADKHAIQGVYLVRGDDWRPAFEVGPDYESYEFTKLDASKPEDKEAVELSWKWEDKVDGMPAVDGKVFK